MSVVIQINGREAIPVRAIPLLTQWLFMSPIDVACVLDGTGGSKASVFGKLQAGDFQAYRMVAEEVQSITKGSWMTPIQELQALSEEVGSSEWRKQSLKRLPAGVFVWKDDYQELHEKNWNNRSQMANGALRNWNGEPSDEDAASPVSSKLKRDDWVDDTPLKRDLMESVQLLKRWREPDYSPFMGSKLRAIVMKGFEVVPVEATGASDGVETKAQPTDTVPGLDAPAKPVQRNAAEDAVKRDTEMELANQEIDALIAKRQAPESEGLPVVPDQRAPVTATVVHDPAPQTTAPAWTLKQTPERLPGYRWPLYCFLLVAHDAGKSRPKPVEVLSAWREKLPPEIARVSAASIDYYDADGNEQTASLEAIRKTIGRMTGR